MSSIEVVVRVKGINTLRRILPELDKINKDSSLFVKIKVEATVDED